MFYIENVKKIKVNKEAEGHPLMGLGGAMCCGIAPRRGPFAEGSNRILPPARDAHSN